MGEVLLRKSKVPAKYAHKTLGDRAFAAAQKLWNFLPVMLHPID